MVDFFMEYCIPAIGLIILLSIATLLVMAVLWGGTQLTQMWCG